jgi:hypothetical protein
MKKTRPILEGKKIPVLAAPRKNYELFTSIYRPYWYNMIIHIIYNLL